MATLKSLMVEISQNWPQAIEQTFAKHPLAQKLRKNFAEAVRAVLADDYGHLRVKASAGSGNWVYVPWLSITDPDITTTAQVGFYPAYLFKADGSGVYLALKHGSTASVAKGDKDAAMERAFAFTERLLHELPELAQWGVKTIDLASSTRFGKLYEASNIIAKYYPSDKMPDDKVLQADLLQIADFYQQAKTFWRPQGVLVADVIDQSPPDNHQLNNISPLVALPKPFILLAGISGTGKTRFVREQACQNGRLEETYQLVCVRPDWHEPSDMLGYISRLGNDGAEYVVTDVLRFIVDAWLEIIDVVVLGDDGILVAHFNYLDAIRPFWLCLDEMNLAPVEQYFADYLSVMETRKWLNAAELAALNEQQGTELNYWYTCEPLLKPSVFTQLTDSDNVGKTKLRRALGLTEHELVWRYFLQHGIAIPFNLIVAGTVNMDETTHGFSRKVIDRALTFDFGAFFPNTFADFFSPKSQPVQLDYPTVSTVTAADFDTITVDLGGLNSIAFLHSVNKVLKGTPFELAYRTLNELLLSVVCFKPVDEQALQAVWDDFLMCKILPRIDGNNDKLGLTADKDGNKYTLLDTLEMCLALQLDKIWQGKRIELLLQRPDNKANTSSLSSSPQSQPAILPPLETQCRSKAKLSWMKARLANSGFTSFWP